MRRKLAVILASDVAGYSRLVSIDEETTIARFAKLKLAMSDLVGSYHGRVFNSAGDSVLAEFPSAVDAVRCAIEIQDSARARNLAYKPDQHMQLRIGIAIGDVLVQEDDLLGDGVNVAARLEGIARPGGICVSEEVYSHVSRNISFSVSDLGPQSLKNIAQPVRVFEIHLPGMLAATEVSATKMDTQALLDSGSAGAQLDPHVSVDVVASERWHSEPVIAERPGLPTPASTARRTDLSQHKSSMPRLVLLSLAAVIVAALASWFVLSAAIWPSSDLAGARPDKSVVEGAIKSPTVAAPATSPPQRPVAPVPGGNVAVPLPPSPALRPVTPDTKPADSRPDMTVPAPAGAATPNAPAQAPGVAAKGPTGPLSPDFSDFSADATMVRTSIAEMPFLRDVARQKVAEVYGQQALHKALAISLDGQGYWSLRWGHETPEAAQTDAMQRCEETAGSACGVYALDAAVVWPAEAIPMPPAVALKPRVQLGAFDPAVLPGQGRDQRVQLSRALAQPGGHSAIVLAPGGRATWFANQSSQAEAMRRALERCGFIAKDVCLPVALDNMALTGFPTSVTISKVDAAAAFLRGKVSEAVIQRYLAAPDWRAVAIGRSNRPSVVTDQPSEAAAIASAVSACARGDSDCRVRMVGPFVVE
jgi:class 3 adenylate cyclase